MKNDSVDVRWSEGDTIWYDAQGLGILFRATVLKQYCVLDMVFVTVKDLPEEYGAYANNPRTKTAGVLAENIYPRNADDSRASILWCEYVASSSKNEACPRAGKS